jgi:hypothetical protein
MIFLTLSLGLCNTPAPMLGMVGWGTSSNSSSTQKTYPCDLCENQCTSLYQYTRHARASDYTCIHFLCTSCKTKINQEKDHNISLANQKNDKCRTILKCEYCRYFFTKKQIDCTMHIPSPNADMEIGSTDSSAESCEFFMRYRIDNNNRCKKLTSELLTEHQKHMASMQPQSTTPNSSKSPNRRAPVRPTLVATPQPTQNPTPIAQDKNILSALNSPYVWGSVAIAAMYVTYKLYQWWATGPEDKETTTEIDTQNQEQQKQTT